MQLSEIPYTYREKAASLVISKANQLTDLLDYLSTDFSPRQKKSIRAGIYFYEIALNLMKPFDPGYNTVLNWKCLALIKLGRFDDATRGYEEIIRLSNETEGKGRRTPSVELAEEQIEKYKGKENLPFDDVREEEATVFDEPPYCMFAEEFCELLAADKFKQAHARMAEKLKKRFPVSKLKSDWNQMTQAAGSVDVVLVERLNEWPGQKKNDVGWCYFSIANEAISEGISVVVSVSDIGTHEICAIEFGRP